VSQLARFDAPGSPATPPRLPFDVPFAEAIAWAEARRAILPDEFYGARLQAVRARSFSIAGLAALDQLQDVADSLAAATAAGQIFREWQKTLPADVFELGPARRELIFRNAVQTHYGIGRSIQQRENSASRPYLMWDAINDSRTRPAHRAMDGHIAPIDDPIWKRWTPPAGHRCRCTRISLTESQARARGYPKLAPLAEPDKGWEGDPTEGNEDLVRIIRERQASCATKFGAKKTRARGLWCDDGPARLLIEDGMEKQGGPRPNRTVLEEASRPDGRHHGLLVQARFYGQNQLRAGIASFTRTIDVHLGWITDPSTKEGVSELSPTAVQYLVSKKWPADVARLREQREIFEVVLQEKQRDGSSGS